MSRESNHRPSVTALLDFLKQQPGLALAVNCEGDRRSGVPSLPDSGRHRQSDPPILTVALVEPLVDDLEEDLLAASVNKVRDTIDEAEWGQDAACQEIRLLLNEAVAAYEDGSVTTLSKIRTKASPRRH